MIQTAVIPNFSIFGSYANMTLAMTVALAMNFGSYIAGYYSGMALGLLEDLLFSQTMGVKVLIYFIIGFIVGYNEDSINKGDVRSGRYYYYFSYFILLGAKYSDIYVHRKWYCYYKLY